MVGTYVSGLIFTVSPKLRFFSIFFTIVIDLMCTYGPLFPISQYTLGSVFMLPIGVSLGISFACMILIFPETLSHVWSTNHIKLLQANKGYLATHDAFLQALSVSNDFSATLHEFEGKLAASRGGQIALFEGLDGQKGFLNLEITYSALGAKDLTKLLQPCRVFTLKLFGLMSFNAGVETILASDGADEPHEDEHSSGSDKDDKKLRPIEVGDTAMLLKLRGRIHEAEAEHHVAFKEDLLPIMLSGSRNLLRRCTETLDEIIAYLTYVNTHRYRGQQSAEQHRQTLDKLSNAANELEHALTSLRDEERLKLIAPYEKHFKVHEVSGELELTPEGARSFRMGARSLFLCLSWCSNALGAGEELLQLTRKVHDLAEQRPKSRIWLPFGLSKVGSLMLSSGGEDALNALPSDSNHGVRQDAHTEEDEVQGHGHEDDQHETLSDDDDEQTVHSRNDPEKANGKRRDQRAKKEAEAAQRKERLRKRRLAQRDADALAPRNTYHRIGRVVAASYRFLVSPRSIFAIRYAVAGLVLWIPSVATQQSASFAYQQRAIWAIIMAQFAVSLTFGEQVFSVVSRVAGTVLGALLGAVGWYISCGKSSVGNPYGFGAVTAVAFVPFVFCRLFAPLQLLILLLLTFVTFILVIGYSWIDAGHLTVSANSGIGIEVAWRRMLLVLIGIGVGVVVQVIPRPPSTREAVRLSFARLSGKKILRLYSSIIEAWATDISVIRPEEASSSSHDAEKLGKEPLHSVPDSPALKNFRAEMLGAYEHHRDLTGKVGLANLDLQIRGPWPAQRYGQLLKTHARMLNSLGQLYIVFSSPTYSQEWRQRYAHLTTLLDPSTISDICLTLSLMGQALQTGQPLPHASALIRERSLRNQALTYHVEERLRSMNSSKASPPLNLTILRSPAFMTHVQGVVALQVFIANLDEAMAIVRDLVGEMALPGFEELRDRWQERAMLLA